MENGQDSGLNTPESFAQFDPDTLSWKTRQSSLFEDSTEYSGRLPNSGIMLSGKLYPRKKSELPIYENACLSLPTPTANEGGRQKTGSPGAAIRPSLGMMARKNMWPTPTVCGNYNRKGSSPTSGDGLATMVMKQQQEISGELNPTWVEWLLGYPLEWTALDVSETPSSPSASKPG